MWKAAADERVGIFALRDSRPCIVEYSEMSPDKTTAVDDSTGKLLYGAGNICNHFYTVDFLRNTAVPALASGGDVAWHVARKKVRGPAANS